MTPRDSLLPEFDAEMADTRRVLERVPEARFDWRPHAKSWTLRELATHVANLPRWAVLTIAQDSLDLAPGGVPLPQATPAASRAELLDRFDGNASAARAAIAGVTEEQLLRPWSLLMAGHCVLTLPRQFVLRRMVMNHMVHHRAQLGVYLRLCDVPVPAIYGPTADEQPQR